MVHHLLLLLSLSYFTSAVSSTSNFPVGQWSTYINSLPNLQLPHVPLLGNGHLGVALNSQTTSTSNFVNWGGVGPGSENTLDLWLDTTSFWSCTVCGGVDPDHEASACCSGVAMGGLSIRFTPTFPSSSSSSSPTSSSSSSSSSSFASFSAQQIIENATLVSSFTTLHGGVITITTSIHPSIDATLTNISWTPNITGGDPQVLTFDVGLWVLGDGRIPGSWNTGTPAPSGVGCTATTPPFYPSPCNSSLSTSSSVTPQFMYVSINASTVNATVMPVTASLAAGVLLASSSGGAGGGSSYVVSTNITSQVNTYPPTVPWEVTMTVSIDAGTSTTTTNSGSSSSSPSSSSSSSSSSWIAVVVAEAETRGPGLEDPAPAALEILSMILLNSTGSSSNGSSSTNMILTDAAAWWNEFWSKSSISLPSYPLVEAFWFGSQYILACTSSTNPAHPAPGLYGAWVTASAPQWHNDYTTDYNYNAPYYGVFSNNHPEQAEAFWNPVLDYLPQAQKKAQVQAGLANVTCPSTALYYACHLSPWGLISLDPMTKFMTWNGPFTSLLFINHFEYTRNVTFAENVILPFLEGLNAWWVCYLNKTLNNGPSDPTNYTYNDANILNPDYEHEGQQVPNPQIAISFLYRTISAQIDILRQLGYPPPTTSGVEDVFMHLPSFNTNTITIPGQTNFTVLNNTRCKNDEFTWYNVLTLEDCEANCASEPACGVFSYCPPPGEEPPLGGCSGQQQTTITTTETTTTHPITVPQVEPKPYTCWGYASNQLQNCVTNNTGNEGWTSGIKQPANASTDITATIFTAFEHASFIDSDWFAAYPLWPSEALDPVSPPWLANFTTDTISRERAAIAQASTRVYIDLANGRPTDVFGMAVRAGANASNPLAFTPEEVLEGMVQMLNSLFGPNLLPYAAGGGIENVGVTRAVNEMLVNTFRLPDYVPPPPPPMTTASTTADEKSSKSGDKNTGKRTRRSSASTSASASAAADDDVMVVAEYAIGLFPFWPSAAPASFSNLLVKGGYLVSATYDNITQAVLSPVIITSKYVLNYPTPTMNATINLVNPWPSVVNSANSNTTLTIVCGDGDGDGDGSSEGIDVEWKVNGVVFAFQAPVGVPCNVSLVG